MTKTPHYLMGTANSRAKTVKKSPTPARRTKSPMNTKKSPMNKSPMSKTAQPKESLWIEELPMSELKLEYNHYRNIYREYRVMFELTITVLKDMGIFLKDFMMRDTAGRVSIKFDEFDNDDDDYDQDGME